MNKDKHTMKKKEFNRRLKHNKPIKGDGPFSDESESDMDSFISESDNEIDKQELRKYISKIFPSKYAKHHIKANVPLKKRRKIIEESSEEEGKESSEEESSIENSTEEESGEESNFTDTDTDDNETINEYKNNSPTKKNNEREQKYNITFTVKPKHSRTILDEDGDDDSTDENSYSSKSESENEDDPVSDPSSSESSDNESTHKKTRNAKGASNNIYDIPLIKPIMPTNIICELELLDKLKIIKQDALTPSDTINNLINICEKKISKYNKKQDKIITKTKKRNHRILSHIFRNNRPVNDATFFDTLDVDNQINIIKELKEINKVSQISKPYRLSIIELNIPRIYKSIALKKIATLQHLDQSCGEYYKIKQWVDTFMQIPFNVYKTLPISFENGIDECHDFMDKSLKILDNAVYGLNDAKMQIMQVLGQFITNPSAIGNAIAIHGPPGTGKTSLVKEGISKILNKPFSFIALGGATDSSFLEGHSLTYEGSTWGKIVQILMDSKCMNPVIYFDELDKISATARGDEIVGILTHLTDTSQNSEFHDKYFTEIKFDLSKCLFIFSYNDESKINPILKDRLYRIETKGYNLKQKTVIATEYLIPKIIEQVKFNTADIIFSDGTLSYIIENFCNKEEGVRNLKRCIEIIYTKLNLYRLMKPDTNLFEQDMSIKVTFPFTVTKDIVDKLIKINSNQSMSHHMLYI